MGPHQHDALPRRHRARSLTRQQRLLSLPTEEHMTQKVLFTGDFACFTRPELSVERVSYDVPTPSACKGMLEAIYRKPEMNWQIVGIQVLKPIAWTSIQRNEIKDVASVRRAGINIVD